MGFLASKPLPSESPRNSTLKWWSNFCSSPKFKNRLFFVPTLRRHKVMTTSYDKILNYFNAHSKRLSFKCVVDHLSIL